MNKSKRIIKSLIISIIIMVIVLIAVLIIYFSTDILKPANQLFSKYFAKEMDKIANVLDISKEKQYLHFLGEQSYDENTTVNLYYTNNMDIKENFNIDIQGSTDNQNKKTFRDVSIRYGENANVANMQFLQENNIYGILLQNIVSQFVSVDMSDKNAVIAKLNIDQTKYNNFIKEYKIKDIIEASGEKREAIKSIINNHKQDFQGNQYNIQKNKLITLSNGESVNTKLYNLTLTGNQTRKIFRDIFKELENQEIVNKLNNVTDEFANLTINMYYENERAARITFEFGLISVRIDLYDNELNILYSDESNIQNNISIKNLDNKRYLKYQDNRNNILNYESEVVQNEGGQTLALNLEIKNDNIKGINIIANQKITTNNNVQIDKSFESVQNVNLSNLDISSVNKALSSLIERINTWLASVQNNNINSEFIEKWMDKNRQLQNKYLELKNSKEAEFNNQFLLYQGTNVDKKIVFNLMDVVGKNIYGYKVNDKNELKIYLEEGRAEPLATERLKQIVNDAKANYNINFEYDSNGKISIILLELYQKQN